MSKSKDEQTRKSFQEKWQNNQNLAFNQTLTPGQTLHNWILKRNGFKNREQAAKEWSSFKRILDAGCGNGRVTALLSQLIPSGTVLGIDLLEDSLVTENLKDFSNATYQKADLTQDLSALGEFDLIYCQEVLHHLPDPKAAFLNLSKRLNPDAVIAIYVYKQKAPAREFMDDYIREQISHLDYEKAMAISRDLAKLGKALSELNVTVKVPDLPMIGIQEGEYDVQRFLYHHFLKCFWNPEMGLEESAALNYDWYHPQHCSRHTLEEVLSWFEEAGLNVIHQHQDHYGITVHGKQNS